MRLISILLVTMMCISALPIEVFAWGKMTHTYTANMIVDDLFNTGAGSSSVKYEGKDYNFAIPEEFLEAIEAYPDAFRAGALGPDMYPDILPVRCISIPKMRTLTPVNGLPIWSIPQINWPKIRKAER